ncbi:unnamed protein product [Trichogramma brassicae]|uniref:Phenoloxidase-activating factor 2 n=1 Tax=Trichogramma brassicae TaxID=86971 RepID=A0A6H5I499_9HYME|nr:unnamed protein product [Trichogramma brassicae]
MIRIALIALTLGAAATAEPSQAQIDYENSICECVPYYQCNYNGSMNDNGEGIIDIRNGFPHVSQGCGIRNKNGVGFRITGNVNNEANFGEFPWMVAVLKEAVVEGEAVKIYQCGGSLINRRAILTAAHCVEGKEIKDLYVRAGEWDTQTTDEPLPHQDRRVSLITSHPDYRSGILFNDYALLILESPFELADNVELLCLPDQDDNFDDANCHATGWGKDQFGDSGRFQVILKSVLLPTVPRDVCQASLRTTRLGRYFRLHETFMCAGGVGGLDTCTGDGGSPLVCPSKQNPARYVQAGIVAWGIGCGQANVPGVYADVAKSRQWIDQTLARLNIDTSSYVLPSAQKRQQQQQQQPEQKPATTSAPPQQQQQQQQQPEEELLKPEVRPAAQSPEKPSVQQQQQPQPQKPRYPPLDCSKAAAAAAAAVARVIQHNAHTALYKALAASCACTRAAVASSRPRHARLCVCVLYARTCADSCGRKREEKEEEEEKEIASTLIKTIYMLARKRSHIISRRSPRGSAIAIRVYNGLARPILNSRYIDAQTLLTLEKRNNPSVDCELDVDVFSKVFSHLRDRVSCGTPPPSGEPRSLQCFTFDIKYGGPPASSTAMYGRVLTLTGYCSSCDIPPRITSCEDEEARVSFLRQPETIVEHWRSEAPDPLRIFTRQGVGLAVRAHATRTTTVGSEPTIIQIFYLFHLQIYRCRSTRHLAVKAQKKGLYNCDEARVVVRDNFLSADRSVPKSYSSKKSFEKLLSLTAATACNYWVPLDQRVSIRRCARARAASSLNSFWQSKVDKLSRGSTRAASAASRGCSRAITTTYISHGDFYHVCLCLSFGVEPRREEKKFRSQHRLSAALSMEQTKYRTRLTTAPRQQRQQQLGAKELRCRERREYGCEDIVLKFLELGQDPNCLVPKVDISPLHMALEEMGGKRVIESLLRSGSDPNFANAKGLTPLHYICFGTGHGGDDLAEMFFEVCDDIRQTVQVNARDNLGNTPLLLSLRWRRNERMLKLLLKRGANPNIAHPEEGWTPLHHICIRAGRGGVDLAEIFFKTCDDMRQKVQVDAVDNFGRTPLRLLFQNQRVDEQLMRLLLRRGANPNFTFSNGSTPLHIVCEKSDVDSCEWLETFLKINKEINQLVHVNVQNNKGKTPLHLALRMNRKKVAERLLRIGADPTLADEDGSTPLHIICEYGNSDDLLKLFFKVCNEIRQKVQVDARNKFDRTPLNVALLRPCRKLVQLLLRNGADPNLVNADGLTPYWLILCQVEYDVDLAKSFLETCVEIQRRVQVNARNSFGQTPLEWAVACLELHLVDVILDHGADLSSFVFPPLHYFGQRLKPMPYEGHMFKLRVASSVLIIVENIERRGYELNQSDALTIMKSFVEYESCEMFEDLDQRPHRWYDDEELRDKFDFAIEQERRTFANRFDTLLQEQLTMENPFLQSIDPDGFRQLPDLKSILEKKDIDRLLTDALYESNIFVSLAIKTSYRDEPDLDSDGKPVTRRTTALHHAARFDRELSRQLSFIVHDLFQVYDKFDANYVDEDGLTHLHVACLFGCEDVVEKFLDHGADPNCRAKQTGYTTLHLATQLRGYSDDRRCNMVKLLLKYGANPNLADEQGRTALHSICAQLGDDWFLAQKLLELCDEKFRPVQLDARDHQGNTPLNLAMQSNNEMLKKYLLKTLVVARAIESTMSHFYPNNGWSDGKPYVDHWPTLGRSPPASPPASPPPPAFDWATIIRRMRITELLRHWNLSFRGDETDEAAWDFLERLGEFFRRHAGARDFAQQQEILIALPCVFTGPAALEWYTAWRPKLRTWRDFREAFEARFCDHYREIVYDCKQRLGERMSEFVTRLRDIVSRIRHQWATRRNWSSCSLYVMCKLYMYSYICIRLGTTIVARAKAFVVPARCREEDEETAYRLGGATHTSLAYMRIHQHICCKDTQRCCDTDLLHLTRLDVD